MPDPVGQTVASPIVDQGVMSLILARLHTFVELDHQIYSNVNLHFPLIQEGLLPVTNTSICAWSSVLVNHLV